MSHLITDSDNLFSTRKPTWHGLGTILDEYPTRAAAQKMVHDWEPIAEPIYRSVPVVTPEGDLKVEYEVIPEKVEYRRSDNGAHLAVNNTSFAPVTNNELWDVAEALQTGVGPGDVLYETGGSLKGGGLVWIMLRLAEPIKIKGDVNDLNIPYYLLQNGHDGMTAFKGSATNVRVVCANTVRMADLDSKARGTEFSFRHTVNVNDRVEEARRALSGWRESIDAFQQLASLMITEKVSRQGELQFLEHFIPAPVGTLTSDRVKHNVEEARGQFMAVYNSDTCEGITGTAWGLFQAASEWSEHVRRAKGNQMESKFKRALLTPNQVLTTAKVFALEAAQVG
jgi:phage/plasmid-like protein (TIGR03299 family)